MATCITMTTRDPFPRTPTPRPTSICQILPKRISYQSLNSPGLVSPIEGRPFSPVDQEESAEWEHININVISPSTASHHSLCSDTDEIFRSPPLALQTSNLLGCQLQTEFEESNTLFSPSAPVQHPGDELLYDVGSEERPDEAFFDPAFQAALAATKQEMKDVALAIWGCPASHQIGSDLHALKQRALELSEFEPLRTRTVGFVGEAGVGKRSVINALLDQPFLAQPSLDSIFSISVITEYRYRPAHHNEPFGIEVDYMTSGEIKEFIEELLRSFQACHIPAFEGIEDETERQEIRWRSDKAWHTLDLMFRNHQDFSQQFLLEYPTDSDRSLVKLLEQWATEFLDQRPGGTECHTWFSTSFNIDECLKNLDPFRSNPTDQDTAALWPYIRVIRVYIRAPILQSGVVLIDCPSPRDDFARARAVERYIRSCHEIFVVTTMDGAVSDRCVQDIMSQSNRHHPLRIVCTKSDDIDIPKIGRRDHELSLQVTAWSQQIEILRKQAKRAEAQRRHGIPGALEEEARCRDMLEDMEFGLKKMLIERRNRQVAIELISKYAGDVHGDLNVFCVSNKDYFKHRYDEQKRAESRLELSGIVNLRKHCHSIPAGAQFEAASAFMEHEVPAFLGSLKQWAVAGADEVNEEKAKYMKGIMKSLEETAIKKLVLPSATIHATKTNLNHEFSSSIVLPIREHRSEWRNAALEASKEWTKWPAKDYSSFCRHHGAHSTPFTGSRNWNEDLLSPMLQHLEPNWDFFQESIEEHRQELISSMTSVLNFMNDQLKQHLDAAPIALQNLTSTINYRARGIEHIINTGFADILESTQHLQSDTLYGHTSSYIHTLMAPAYNAASLIYSKPISPSSPTTPTPRSFSPTIADRERKDLITTHIASARIFPKLSTMIERAHHGFLRAAFDNMVAGITTEVDALIRDIYLAAPLPVEREGEEGGSEARRYTEFSTLLKGRIVQAELVLEECAAVVNDIRAIDLERVE